MFIMGSSSMRIAAIVFYLCFLTFATFHNCFCNGISNIVCSKTEKQALLKFKQDLKDPSNRLSSWAGDNCSVHVLLSAEHEQCDTSSSLILQTAEHDPCSNSHHSGLNLKQASQQALGNLTMMRYLDLSWNHFGGIRIPSFIGSIGSLRYLDLSHAEFSGAIPHQLGNLTMIRYLYLNWNQLFQGSFPETETELRLHGDNLHWVSGHWRGLRPSQLQSINATLHYIVQISRQIRPDQHPISETFTDSLVDYLQRPSQTVQLPAIAQLPPSTFTLVELGLTGHVHEIHLRNADCHFNGNVFEYEAFFRDWPFAYEACWSYHPLGGKINHSLLDLKHLRYLDLSGNNFGGIRIPSFIGSIGSFRYLDLSNVGFSGAIPYQLGNLTMMRYLDLSWNHFGGIRIPSFIGSIGSLRYLNLSHAEFSGAIPHQLGNLTMIRYLYLNWNQLFQGIFPETETELRLHGDNLHWVSGLRSLQYLDMSWANLSKAVDWLEVTSTLPSLVELHLRGCDLKYSSPSTTINFTSLHILDLSGNNFASFIPKWIFSLNLVSLDISSCYGPIPNGIQNMTSLKMFYAAGNNLNSSLPKGLFSLKDLLVLDLGYNKFQGPISIGLLNMTSLRDLDLSYNFFTSLPNGLLSSLSRLELVILKGNLLHGVNSGAIGNVTSLISLDLSNNFFTSLRNGLLSSLSRLESVILSGNLLHGVNSGAIGNVTSLISLDLSNNFFTSLPNGLFRLSRLESVILAHNLLQGVISGAIGNLTSLISLDMSYNQLEGNIPRSLGKLCKLKTIDLSYNKLGGDITELFRSFSHCILCGLESMSLANNYLGGQFSNELDQFKNLTYLSLKNNSIFWSHSNVDRKIIILGKL
ncbi:hypothetical protein TEA_027916 [Camellia sinensis var. sinensis]|uniref:Uncharacterized protein n=2 Tax=Camellia sinensis TaxID=4442 RepID=A0A4S4EZ40_CAMSN|nr:hypothetical protein TEA_027916 [Camellia sinensis var. sinensis]